MMKRKYLHNLTRISTFIDCVQSTQVCGNCEASGQRFVEAPLRACRCCIASGKQCVSLFIPVWTADCEENNKQAMVKLLEMKEKGTNSAELQLLVPLPEATHGGDWGEHESVKS